jgi:hypothetical protein
MGMIMFRCPQTGREISTGLSIEPAHFKALPVFFSRSYCPICRTEHEWFAKDAWVREESPHPEARNGVDYAHLALGEGSTEKSSTNRRRKLPRNEQYRDQRFPQHGGEKMSLPGRWRW